MGLVVVKTCTDTLEADLIKGQLEAAGIKCVLQNDGVVNANILLSNAVGGVQIVVNEEEAEKALELMEQAEDLN